MLASDNPVADVHRPGGGGFTVALRRGLEWLAAGLERHPGWFLAGLAALYLTLVCWHSLAKPLWFDELFTVYLSRLSRAGRWSALASGTDGNPPLVYWVTRALFRQLGEHALVARLPEILGFLTMSVCLFRFLARRCTVPFAAAGALFPLVSGALPYADEARPYGLVLGFAGLALLSWQKLAEGKARALPFLGLCASLAAAVSSHYYAVFVAVPIAAAELVRTWQRRRPDPAVWLALALGGLPLAWYLPLVRGMNATVFAHPLASPDFWAKPGLRSLLRTYYSAFHPALPFLLAAVLCSAFVSAGEPVPPRTRKELPVPAHEYAVAVAFAGVPVLVAAFTRIYTGYYLDRYALCSILGFALLTGYLGARFLRTPAAGVALMLVLGIGFVAIRVDSDDRPYEDSDPEAHAAMLFHAGAGAPIAVANPLVFLKLSYYAPAELRSRLVYLSDTAVATRYPDFIPELALLRLRRWTPIHIEEYRPFLESGRRFFVYGTSSTRLEWLPRQLLLDGRTVRLYAQSGECVLYEVTASR
jgi:hypothetical protein